MTRLIGVAIAFALTLAVAPAMAGGEARIGQAPDPFHAFSTLPPAERAALTPLADHALAALEGQGHAPDPEPDPGAGAMIGVTIAVTALGPPIGTDPPPSGPIVGLQFRLRE